MDRVRMVTEVAVRDYEGAIEFLGGAARHVEEHLLGTLAWDAFTDETHEHMIWYEEFADEHALLEYERSMTEHGYRREVRQYLDLGRVVVLGPVSDPDLLDMLQQIGGIQMDHVLGAAR